MSLSDDLRELANDVEDTEADDVEQAHLSFRMDEDDARNTELPIGQVDDPYDGTVMVTVFTDDL